MPSGDMCRSPLREDAAYETQEQYKAKDNNYCAPRGLRRCLISLLMIAGIPFWHQTYLSMGTLPAAELL